MPRERLHYQKSNLQKLEEGISGSFIIKSALIKRACLFVFVILTLCGFFIISGYQHQPKIGHPSSQTYLAEKKISLKQTGRVYEKGSVVVKKGEIINADKYQALILQNKELQKKESKQEAVFIAISFAVLSAMGFYLRIFHRSLFESTRLSSVLVVMIAGVLAIGLISEPISPFFIVVPASAIIAVHLFNLRVALVAAVATSIIAGLLSTQAVVTIAIGLAGSMIAVYAVIRHNERILLLKTSMILSASLAVINFMASSLIYKSFQTNAIHASYGVAGALTSIVIALGMMPFLQDIFGITTDFKLLELTQSNKDILKKLMIKAPGTYSHSLNVASMVESVAPAVKADPLMSKAGALYHDIGKIRRPYFFTENQSDGLNPHDKTNANLSYLIITAHVREGVEIAKRNNLPQEVIDIISQHHGSTVVQYFYNLALKSGKKILECDFRYHEHKPRTKEAALVMLADTVEAAARSYMKPSAKRLNELVRTLIQKRIDDNQLCECDLSLSDVEKIKNNFADMLINIYHPRVKYPKREAKKQKNVSNN